MVNGEIGAFALTEPGAGSDAGAGTALAKKEGEEYVLNGTKCFISNGGYARMYVVFASTDPAKGVKALSAFIVERDREGLVIGDTLHKLGIRSSNTVELVLRNLRVPADHLLGKEGDGMKIAMQTLDMARPAIAAIAVGVAQRALDEGVKYLQKRFPDRTVRPDQEVQFKLADMEIQIQAARQLLHHTLMLKDAGVPYTKESAMVKTFCSDTAMRVTRDALEILGAYGYSTDCEVEKLVRDAKIMQIYEGTNQIQRLVVGRAILSNPVAAKGTEDAAKTMRGAV
jgi:alkylation response protein AidB-like acyl-CoA dehydrogenase